MIFQYILLIKRGNLSSDVPERKEGYVQLPNRPLIGEEAEVEGYQCKIVKILHTTTGMTLFLETYSY